ISGAGRLLGGGDSAGITIFFPRIKDDDGPLGAQAFLQRVARLHLGSGGEGEQLDFPASVPGGFPGPQQIRRSIGSGWFDVWADGYVNRWLYLGASFRFEDDTWSDRGVFSSGWSSPIEEAQHELLLTPQVELGVRWYDVRISFGWGVTPTKLDDDDFHV